MALLALVSSLIYLQYCHCQIVVDTEYGPVEGHVVPVDNGRFQSDVNVFYAVPYGKSTAGENRFRVSISRCCANR